jgi:predicted acetyltransferase
VPTDARPELHPLEPDDLEGFLEAFDLTFGLTPTEAALTRLRRVVDPSRFLAARVGGTTVGTAGAYAFELALPGAEPAPCAGVTLVSVRADHRRRGLLRRMMARLLDDAADRGEDFAALWASEDAIYGRFGYGAAAPTTRFDVLRAQARFRVDGPVDEVELIDADEAAARYPAIYDAARQHRPLLLGRSPSWWRRDLDDPPERREGAGEKRYAVLGERGYAIHRLRPSWGEAGPEGTVELQDLVALDPAARAALWRFVIDTDLSSHTVASRRPVDDPLPAMLADPAAARPRDGGALYLRLVDVRAALTARRYLVDDTLVIELHDAFRPANTGRWRLDSADGEATCEPTDAPADLELDAEALATVAFGGVRVTTLAAAGRLAVRTPGAAGRADRLFATELAPWHGFMF